MRLNKKGFSMMELIIAVAVIAILSIAVISVYNPSSRIADANAVLRAKASESLAQAIKTSIINNGEMPAELQAISELEPTLLVTTGSPGADTYYCAKLGFEISKVNIASNIQPLLGELPIDPALDVASTDTGYFVWRKGNLFQVASCGDTQDCSTCTDNCVGCPTCGNNVIEGNEACDEGNLVREKCSNGILEVGTFCDFDCSSEYVLTEVCDYDAPFVAHCNQVGVDYTVTDIGPGQGCAAGCQQWTADCVAAGG